MLLSTLSAMQEKAQHLEYNLSAETRIKLDLFSALGDARRQLEIAQGFLSFVPFFKTDLQLSLNLIGFVFRKQNESFDCVFIHKSYYKTEENPPKQDNKK